MAVHTIVFGFGFVAGGLAVSWLWQRDVDRLLYAAKDAIAEARAQSAANALNEMYRPARHVRDGRIEPLTARSDDEAWDNLMERT